MQIGETRIIGIMLNNIFGIIQELLRHKISDGCLIIIRSLDVRFSRSFDNLFSHLNTISLRQYYY